MEDYAFTKAKIAADRKAFMVRLGKCAAVTVAAGLCGAALNGAVAAAVLAGVAAVASPILF